MPCAWRSGCHSSRMGDSPPVWTFAARVSEPQSHGGSTTYLCEVQTNLAQYAEGDAEGDSEGVEQQAASDATDALVKAVAALTLATERRISVRRTYSGAWRHAKPDTRR